MSKIPNFENVGENFRGLPYDPDNGYSVAYQWGTTGILYNRKEVGQLDESWDPMWDAEFKGQMSMLNDTRETIGAALYRLGYSVNATDQAQLDEANAELQKQKPLLRGYFSAEARNLVQNGDILLGHVFSGDAFLAIVGQRGPGLHHPEARRRPAGRTTCPSRTARAPGQRPQVHKPRPRRQGRGPRSPTTPTTTPPTRRATGDRPRAEGASWLHPDAKSIRAAGGHRGRRGGDPRVRAHLHRGKELLAWGQRTRLDPQAGGAAHPGDDLARALLPDPAAPDFGLLVRDQRDLRRDHARLQPDKLPQGLRPAVPGHRGPLVRHSGAHDRCCVCCSGTPWRTS